MTSQSIAPTVRTANKGSKGIRYVMVSSEIRRDLEQPLDYFERLDIFHLYNRAPWKDMRANDFGAQTSRFLTPLDLFWQLMRIRPEIIQGPEPFSLLMFPYLVAVYCYLLLKPEVKLVTLSLEPIPLAQKYHPCMVPMFDFVLKRWFKRASVIFWFDRGSYENLLRHDAPPEKLINQLYGSWGVDLSNFSPDGPKVDYPKDKVTLLYVGRLAKVKGVRYLIEAFKLLREKGLVVHLAVVGDGPERAVLEQQAEISGYKDDIVFHGLVKNADLPPYMRAADVFVLPSITSKLWVQQLSMTAWQAMACGLPVVTTDTGQMREFTPPGTGFLVPERDPGALAEALSKLIKDADEREAMSKAAFAYSHDRFDTVKNVARAEQTILAQTGFVKVASEV